MLENLRDHTREEVRSLRTAEQQDISRHHRLGEELARFGRISRMLAKIGIGSAAWHTLELQRIEGRVLARRELFGDFCECGDSGDDTTTQATSV
ncbi:MAG TPA: hypothetical protein PKV96_01695 [Candidatus Saccharimonas sp.]|jgi:hypothetical protein|nr:hypothetical protein [Candidatus Saccharimonas sp.]